jgi:predicted glycosyltransferase
MNILFYFGHPAQYLFLRATIKEFIKLPGHGVIITIKSKDVLEELIKSDNLPYINIQQTERGNSKFSIVLNLLKRTLKLFRLALTYKPDLMIGTDATIAQIGFLLNIHRITITEDDYDVIKSLAKLTYPYTEYILCPNACHLGKWAHKKIGYSGYMKLGYLHPSVFKPDKLILNKYSLQNKYALIRLAKLNAHHDFGIKGISEATLQIILNTLKEKGITAYISSEKEIPSEFKPYLLAISPSDMHHVLANAQLLICDSQSMSVEAAVLGIPSIRISDFAGRISVLEELERSYELTFGISPLDTKGIFRKLNELLALSDINETFQLRKEKMLKEKINVSAYLLWLLKNYPESIDQLKKDPAIENQFIVNS